MHRTRLLIAVLVLIGLGLPLYGQTMGEIVGEVRDTTDAVVPGAVVTVTNVGTNAVRSVTTNDAGLYSFPSLNPGKYRVKVESKGFRTVTQTDLELQVQQTARVDFKLEVGQVSESVEVSANASLLATENATVGTVIGTAAISELPLNGRSFFSLVALSPNVTYGFAPAAQAGGRLGGSRGNLTIALSGSRSTWQN
jgi:hypothetical protein